MRSNPRRWASTSTIVYEAIADRPFSQVGYFPIARKIRFPCIACRHLFTYVSFYPANSDVNPVPGYLAVPYETKSFPNPDSAIPIPHSSSETSFRPLSHQ